MLGWPGYWVLIKERVQLQNQMESLLEEGRIKLSSVISDLLGVSARRILRALADGQTDSGTIGRTGDDSLALWPGRS